MSSGDLAPLTVSLLGPFQLRVGGRPVAVPSRRNRALLAALALRAGRSVRKDALVEQVWYPELPRWPRSGLHTVCNRLRMLTGTDVIRSELDGYLLDVVPEAVDVLRFQQLTAQARGEEPARARATLDEALALWRGDPLAGAGSQLLERDVVPALLEQHLAAVERRIDLELAGGRPSREWVPRLAELAARHPLRESLWARLIAFLGAAGRPAEALNAYQVIRTRLAAELGSEPSPEVRRAFAQVLAVDAAPGGVPSAGVRVPHQLPPAPTGFVGRTEDLAALDTTLDGTGQPAGAAPVVVVHGPGGVGKTVLALRWAHRIADRFPDGQLYVDMHGYSPDEPVDPAVALEAVLRALGVAPAQLPPTLAERSALLRTRLAARRVLLLVDNVRTVDQVRPLLPGGPSLVLVTSRSELRELRVPDARGWRLRELPPADGAELLARSVGGARAAAEPVAVAELVALCGRLPLALVIAGERAACFPDAPLRELVEELRDGRHRLDLLSDPYDTASDPRAVFSWSYRALSPAAARAFRLLGLHPGPRVHVEAAVALLGVDVAATRRVLDDLVSVHLLESHRPGVYRFHDLLRVYAAERAAADEPAADRDAATRRMLDWYLHSAYAAWTATFGAARHTAGPPAHGLRPMRLTTGPAATAAYLQSRDVLVGIVEYAAEHRYDEHAWRLAELLSAFQQRHHHVGDALRTTELAVRCAERTGRAEARMLTRLARTSALRQARRHSGATGGCGHQS